MTMMTSGAKPCRECGTEGGLLGSNTHQPWRGHGLCRTCYSRHYQHGEYASDNLCRRNYKSTEHMLWHTPMLNRQHHAVIPFGYDAAKQIADAERRAADWMSTHCAVLLDWPDPSLSLFGAANAQRAA